MANNQVKFYRGNKPTNFDNLDKKGIYFFEDTRELWVNDKFYGMSEEQATKLEELDAELSLLDSALSTTDALAQQLLGIVGADDSKGLRVRLAAVEEQAVENANIASSAVSAASSAQEKANEAFEQAELAFEKAGVAQNEIDTLEELVGQLPEGTSATSVFDYINIKTAGIATDMALEELNNQVSGLQTTVQDIKNDYVGQTEFNEQINDLGEAIVATQDIASDAKTRIDAFMNANEIGDDVVDTLKEIQDYITSDLKKADELVKKIGTNETAIANIDESIKNINADLVTLSDNDILATERLTSLESRLGDGEGSVTEQIAEVEKAAKDYTDGLIDELVEGTLNDIQEAAKELKSEVEANAEAISGVSEIANQAAENILTLQTLVEEKAAVDDLEALREAINGENGYADRIGSAEINIEALQETVAELDKIDHTHTDLNALNDITASKITIWDSAYDNAVNYTDQCLMWNVIESVQ